MITISFNHEFSVRRLVASFSGEGHGQWRLDKLGFTTYREYSLVVLDSLKYVTSSLHVLSSFGGSELWQRLDISDIVLYETGIRLTRSLCVPTALLVTPFAGCVPGLSVHRRCTAHTRVRIRLLEEWRLLAAGEMQLWIVAACQSHRPHLQLLLLPLEEHHLRLNIVLSFLIRSGPIHPRRRSWVRWI